MHQFKAWQTIFCYMLVFVFIWYFFIYRVLIATQHFLKSSALVENMYTGMPHHERYFTLNVVTDSKCQYRPADLPILHRNWSFNKQCPIKPLIKLFSRTAEQQVAVPRKANTTYHGVLPSTHRGYPILKSTKGVLYGYVCVYFSELPS